MNFLRYSINMLDIKFIRENKDISKRARKKRVKIDIQSLIVLMTSLKLLKEIGTLRAEVNKVSNDIVRDQDPALKIQLIEEMRVVKEEIKTKEENLKNNREWQK